MSNINDIQNFDTTFYNLKDKLFSYIIRKSEEAFEKADTRRNLVKTKDDFLRYQNSAHKTLVKSVGKIPYDRTLPLDGMITGVTNYDGLLIQNIIFRSRKDVFVTGNLYIPQNTGKKLGTVLFQPGYDVMSRFDNENFKACTAIAKTGLIVFTIDMPGQGERQSYSGWYGADEQQFRENRYCGNQCILAGESIVKYFLADAMRAIDYLESRPEVDAGKIGVTGYGEGGAMAAVLAALDDRVKAAAPGGGYNYKA